MNDIKNRKVNNQKTLVQKSFTNTQKNLITEKVEHFYFTAGTPGKKTISKLSATLFSFMFISIFFYIFMISSSIFYSVRQSQFNYKSENISNNAQTKNLSTEQVSKYSKDRISYINLDSDTSISLK